MNATIKRIGGNLFEVVGTGEYAGVVVLVSYETPVAYRNTFKGGETVVERSRTRFSASTERHLRKWGNYGNSVEQTEMDRLLRGMTGSDRLTGRAVASKLGRTANTRGVNYEDHTEPGNDNLVVPVYRRSYR